MGKDTARKRQASPELECVDTIRVEVTLQPAPLDPVRVRKGRPARSPSPPPEEPTPGQQNPPQA